MHLELRCQTFIAEHNCPTSTIFSIYTMSHIPFSSLRESLSLCNLNTFYLASTSIGNNFECQQYNMKFCFLLHWFLNQCSSTKRSLGTIHGWACFFFTKSGCRENLGHFSRALQWVHHCKSVKYPKEVIALWQNFQQDLIWIILMSEAYCHMFYQDWYRFKDAHSLFQAIFVSGSGYGCPQLYLKKSPV